MKLYNTLTRKLETFTPKDPNQVKIYTCGPTVYDYVHIGNLTAYVYWDLLLRALKLNHYRPYRVLNLTDVGHLSSDADDGEDKLEKGAKKTGKTVWEVAETYSQYFFKQYQSLNLLTPDKVAKATDYIAADLKIIDTLTKKGYTYQTSDGIYFDTSKFETYGDFARLDLENLAAGARVAFSSEKRHLSDFALWKFVQPGEKHDMNWPYLDRPGYPGWHLECSTIINQELGPTIDIHTGGIDHIPVHHTNEIAQSEAVSGQILAHFWLHCNFITVEGEKISKSLGNTILLEDLSDKGFDPLDFKLWVLQGHYQSARNFSYQDLESAKHRRLNWRNRIAKLLQHPETTASDSDIQDKLLEAVNQNLNSALAFSLIDNSRLNLSDWEFVDQLFGLNLINSCPQPSESQLKIITEREQARQNRDFSRSDQLRSKLQDTGLSILDTDSGPLWQYLA